MGGLLGSPWRETKPFKEAFTQLKEELTVSGKTRLNITLVGRSGAGKSSLINSIYSISKGRIANKTSVKSGALPGFGTHYFTGVKAGEKDLFKSISLFDTMGIGKESDNLGISMDQLKACLDGRLNVGHKGEILPEGTKNNRPHCILIVLAATELDLHDPSHSIFELLKQCNGFIPEGAAKIAVLTKIDKVCPDSKKNFEFIYKSKKVKALVEKAEAILGIPENHIFPIINFVDEIYVNEEKSVPIMFLLKIAFGFAMDRKENE